MQYRKIPNLSLEIIEVCKLIFVGLYSGAVILRGSFGLTGDICTTKFTIWCTIRETSNSI